MNQLIDATGECIRELHGAVERIARQVDHDVRAERGDPFAELPALFFRGPIDHGMVDHRPTLVGKIWLPLTPRDADGLVPATDEPRHQVRTDVPQWHQ